MTGTFLKPYERVDKMIEKLRSVESLSDDEKIKYSDMIKYLGQSGQKAESFIFCDESLKQFNHFKKLLDEQSNSDELPVFMPLPPYLGLTAEEMYSEGLSLGDIKVALTKKHYEPRTYIKDNLFNTYAENITLSNFRGIPTAWDDRPLHTLIAISTMAAQRDSDQDSRVLGEWIEEAQDKIDKLASSYKIPLPYSIFASGFASGLSIFITGAGRKEPHYTPVLLSYDSTDEHVELIYSLSKTDLRKISSYLKFSPIRNMGNSPEDRYEAIREIIDKIQNEQAGIPKDIVKAKLMEAFYSSISNSEPIDKPQTPFWTTRELMDCIDKMYIADKGEYVSSNSVKTDRIYNIADNLVSLSKHITPREMAAIVYSICLRSSVARTGSADEYVSLFESFVGKEDEVDFLKIIADVVLNFNEQLPSVKEWSVSFSEGVTNLGGDIAVSIAISSSAINKKRNITKALEQFRQSLK